MKAKKSLGQHFLKSKKALATIIDALTPSAHDILLEIGPGKGVLTEQLLKHAKKVVALEKDTELIPILAETFKPYIAERTLTLIHTDALQFDPAILRQHTGMQYKLVGNIPYNITGALFRHFLSASYLPERIVFLIQKEVAQRIVARDKKESILSLSIKLFGTPTLLLKVPRGAFVPSPNVDSAIIVIERITRILSKEHEELFFSLIKVGFHHKRKKVVGNLRSWRNDIDWEQLFVDCSISISIRAEDLTLALWLSLVEKLGNKNMYTRRYVN